MSKYNEANLRSLKRFPDAGIIKFQRCASSAIWDFCCSASKIEGSMQGIF